MRSKLIILNTETYSDIQVTFNDKLHIEDGSSVALKCYAIFLLLDLSTEKIIASTNDLVIEDKNNPYDSRSKTGFEPYLLPKLSKSSIKLVVDYFNRTGKKEIDVETDDYLQWYTEERGWQPFPRDNKNYLPEHRRRIIKLNSDGNVDIIIQEKKESSSDAFDRGFTSGLNSGIKLGLNTKSDDMKYTKEDFINALHSVEIIHNKNYSHIWKDVEKFL